MRGNKLEWNYEIPGSTFGKGCLFSDKTGHIGM